MKRILFFIVLSGFFLSSCGSEISSTGTVSGEKTPFLIDTYTVGQSVEKKVVEKSVRITPASSLTLSADTAGEVTSIALNEGQNFAVGTRIVSLQDTVNSYDIRLEQARNTLITQDAGIDATRVGLDRAVADSEIALAQAERALATLKNKNPLAYDSLVTSNQKTLDLLDPNYQTYLSDIIKSMDQILFESDKILGISSQYEYANNGWEPYLGAHRGDLKAISDRSYGKAWAKLAELRSLSGAITPENANVKLTQVEDAYTIIRGHVDDMILMIQNNAVGAALPPQMNEGWTQAFNGFRTLLQGSYTGWNQWKTNTSIFLKNYKANEEAVKLALLGVDIKLTDEQEKILNGSQEAKLLYDQNRIDLDDRMKSAELALKQAKTAHDSAIKNRDATLAQLQANKQNANLSIDQAERDFSKLSVKAPFAGSVTRVIATVGQKVSMGTPLVEVVSNDPQILVDLEGSIVAHLAVGSVVKVRVADDNILDGSVIAISRTAGSNLLYTTRISVPKATDYLGSAAVLLVESTEVGVQDDAGIAGIVLPLRSVKIISEQEGEIALLTSSGIIQYKSVQLGSVGGIGVEVVDRLPSGTQIILSDTSHFDPNKNIFQRK